MTHIFHSVVEEETMQWVVKDAQQNHSLRVADKKPQSPCLIYHALYWRDNPSIVVEDLRGRS
jgi:hypothetical protein